MKKLMKSVLACALAFAMVLIVMPVNTYAANKKAAKASISVQAKNATITNKASVKSIEIKDTC